MKSFRLAHGGGLVAAIRVLSGMSPVSRAGDIPVGRLGKADYGDWQAGGQAFQKGPVSGDLVATLEIEGSGGVGILSSEIDGDGPTGTLTSPEFRISRPYIS